jgi:hypothetical protein
MPFHSVFADRDIRRTEAAARSALTDISVYGGALEVCDLETKVRIEEQILRRQVTVNDATRVDMAVLSKGL